MNWCNTPRPAVAIAMIALDERSAESKSPFAHDFNIGIDVAGTHTVIAGKGVALGGYITPLKPLSRLRQIAQSRPRR